jgi:integrase
MRYREPFTLFLRKLPSGKKIWYYQTYDKTNNRTCGFSTGKKSKTAAKAYCFDLLKKALLIPERRLSIKFEKFAKNWWDWENCVYLKYMRKRKTVTLSYANTAKGVLKNYIMPVFGNKNLHDISSYHIENWLDSFSDKGLSNATARLSLAILKVMLKEAVRRELISSSPAEAIRALKVDSVSRGVLNHYEVKKLFDLNHKEEIWIDDISYFANMLSACTGMRISEILAVRGECLEADYIRVDKQYNEKYGMTETKSHCVREVIIPEQLMLKLREVSETNCGGFLFSFDGGKKPVGPRKLRVSLVKALENIGIDDDKRKERNICFHSWRHYFNTTMRSNNIMDGKLRAMVGHSSPKMTEHYTHFSTEDFKDIQNVQNKIINFDKVG